MSIRIALDKPPEFYTNLDTVCGDVLVSLNRPEAIGAIIVKLEGEARTALAIPDPEDGGFGGVAGRRMSTAQYTSRSGDILNENHKILYKVQQVFPGPDVADDGGPATLMPGSHGFSFRFKIPFNNICSDPRAMAKISGFSGPSGILGLGGIRLMNGSKQLLYPHVTRTLPPSFTGFPREAEIRYYIKVTIQRPGFFKENWRHQIGLKFMPIEPPRPAQTTQEAYARRPFTFDPRSSPASPAFKKRASLFGNFAKPSAPSLSPQRSMPQISADNKASASDTATATGPTQTSPSYEISARLPHPSILTCNKALPLRILAKKLNAVQEQVYLTSLQVDLIGATQVRCQDLHNEEKTRWVVVSHPSLCLPIGRPEDPEATETPIPDSLWSSNPLPNTVMPSFVTCNLRRTYSIELKIGLTWGKPGPEAVSPFGGGFFLNKGKQNAAHAKNHRAIFLPLHFSAVEVFSGIAPPPELLDAMANRPPPKRPQKQPRPQSQLNSHTRPPVGRPTPSRPGATRPPQPPPRPTPQQVQQQAQQQEEDEELYPPQLTPGETAPPGQPRPFDAPPAHSGVMDTSASASAEPPSYDDAPPSYDEAIAEQVPGPRERPAYSGVTNENSPSLLPEKN